MRRSQPQSQLGRHLVAARSSEVTPHESSQWRALPQIVGREVAVPLVTGESVTYVNLDYAATTPPLLDVVDALEEFLPFYSSVHRGAGYKSRVSTAAYEGARDAARRFFNVPSDDTIIFTRNTTDSINLLSSALPSGSIVVAFDSEHHANLLPWRRPGIDIHYLPAADSSGETLRTLERRLAGNPPVTLVAITGASNVTGELWPVREVTQLSHRWGARVLLDAAQLAPHHTLDLSALDVDYAAISGHKMYAPFGAGLLIGRSDWLGNASPFLRGGGAVDFVALDDVLWTSLPDRQEAGSPNVIGAVSLAVALESLSRCGMPRLMVEEAELANYARRSLADVPGLEIYCLWGPEVSRIGVITFNLRGYEYNQVATILSSEYGIGVRDGCFCAHPLMLRLLKIGGQGAREVRERLRAGDRRSIPGAVRASIGLGSSREDVDRLVAALRAIGSDGPQWTYRFEPDTGTYHADPDPRELPLLRIPFKKSG